MKIIQIMLVVLLSSSVLKAQNKSNFTVSGTVKDSETGEVLIGATITLYTNKPIKTITNKYGFYSINAETGQYHLFVSFNGYLPDTTIIVLDKNISTQVSLKVEKKSLQEVVITSGRKNNNVYKPLMGAEKLNMTEINKLPVLLGERDVMKSIQLMPGFKSAGEGSNGFYVRGGGTDENLILLDEAPVYNASHLLGFFSTFNSDAVKDVNVFKGGMPAQYGGRLSSVMDVTMKDGNTKKLDVTGGIGLISSRLNVSGPVVKDKTGSFMVSARRTYVDVFLGLIPDTGQGKQSLYFYDLNLKANYKLGKKDKLFLSGYFGRDLLAITQTFVTDWGNKTGTLRWNHIWGDGLFSNTSLIYSNYSYQIKVKAGDAKFKIFSKIEDFNLKQDFDWAIRNGNKLKFGINIIKHIVSPGNINAENAASGASQKVQDRFSIESAAYVSHEYKVSEKLELIYGLRASNISVLGPGSFYTYDKQGNITSTKKYNDGERVINYFNLEPRFSASFIFNTQRSLKVSYNRNVQNLHLLANTTTASPTDVWMPSTNNVKPEIADQIALGIYQNSNDETYECSAEVYYKSLQNQILYRNGANLLGNDNIERELVYGKGRAYGLELLIRKKRGKLTGWVGYTLSKVEKKFDDINNGQYFNARQDRTHDISIVGMYKLNDKWDLSAIWVYNTGSAVTFPSGKYSVNGQTTFLYTERNGYRMPDYHRLDIAATLNISKPHPRLKYTSSFTFGLYNAYGRENAYSIDFRENKTDPTKTEAVRTALFRWVPSVTWNFKF